MRKGGEAGLTTRPAASPNYAPDGVTQGVCPVAAGSRRHRPTAGTVARWPKKSAPTTRRPIPA